MKKALVNYKVLILCCAIGLAAAAGTRAFRWPRHRAAVAPASVDALAAIPRATGRALSDRAVEKAMTQLRQKPDDCRMWSALGDVLMQKARETGDASYYAHAESAYRKDIVDPKNDSWRARWNNDNRAHSSRTKEAPVIGDWALNPNENRIDP